MTVEPLPKDDEIEVTLIGPGYGEAILIHVGSGQWLLVDSCVNQNNAIAPIEYLASIGVAPRDAIKGIVITHWHDDHVRGISNIVEYCSSALVCMSPVHDRDEFKLEVAVQARSLQPTIGSGLIESRRLQTIRRSDKGRGRYYKAAGESKLVLQWSSDDLAHGKSCKVWTLSPNDDLLNAFIASLYKIATPPGSARGRAVAPTRNGTSVVILIQFDKESLLLGADLEEGGGARGWTFILADPARPIGKSTLYKVPHHGSENAHHIGVWSQMLVDSPHAILTPYMVGSTRLPKPSDISRINQHTNSAHLTAPPAPLRSRRRPQAVEKTLSEMGNPIFSTRMPTGRVTFRFRNNFSDPAIYYEGAARQL